MNFKPGLQMITAMPKPFPWLASLLYGGVLLAGIYYPFVGLCGSLGQPGRIGLFAGILLLLLAVEQFERQRAPTSRRLAIGLLLGRIALFEAVVMLDCSGFSKFLYLIVPFAAYFCLGKKASYGSAAFYVGIFALRLSMLRRDWYLDESYVADLLIFAIGMVFVLAMADVVRDAQASRTHAEDLLDNLEVSHRRLQAYAGQVAELATAEERNRLARDIHDSLGHYLTAITVQLEKALAFRERAPEAAEQAVRDAKRSARAALQDVRHSVGAMRHTEELFSLTAVLPELVARLSNNHLTVNLHIEGDEADYPRLVLMTIFRVAQGALTNVQKHAQASQADIEVVLTEQEIRLCMRDNGCGFDTAVLINPPAERESSFGLQGIQERLELVGGTMQLTSRLNEGTQLLVAIPKRPLTLGTLAAVKEVA
jgi:signal transduction histidine kinase